MNIYLGKLSLIIVFNFYISASLIFCQQGKYKRKSITSLGTYTASGNSLKYYLGNQIHLKQILDNPRFDYNVIGNQFIENFNNALEDQTIFRSNNKFSINLNPLGGNFLRHKDMPDIIDYEKIESLLNQTILNPILDVLNNPEIIELRSNNLFDESLSQSFAKSKAKSLGITEKEISKIMNSSYVYLIYIESEFQPKGDLYTVMGGLLCWQLVFNDSTGKASYINIINKNIFSTGFTGKISEEGSVDFRQTAYKSFGDNIEMAFKAIDDFRLSAQIIEKNNNFYSFQMDFDVGLPLNKSFFLAEIEEDEFGNQTINKRGFTRIINSVDNNHYSVARKYFGKGVNEGDLIIENTKGSIELQYGWNTINDYKHVKMLNTASHGFSFCLNRDISDPSQIKDLWYSDEVHLQTMVKGQIHYTDSTRIIDSINYEEEYIIEERLHNFDYDYSFLFERQTGLSKRFSFNRLFFGIGMRNSLSFGFARKKIQGIITESFANNAGSYLSPGEKEDIIHSLWILGAKFIPTVELGFYLTNNTKIILKSNFEISPGTLMTSVYTDSYVASAYYSEKMQSNFDDKGEMQYLENKFENWADIKPYWVGEEKYITDFKFVTTPSINIAISRSVTLVPKSWSFLNMASLFNDPNANLTKKSSLFALMMGYWELL